MPHEIAALVTCRLCNKKIAGPPLILGPGQSNRVGAFMQGIATHLTTTHPQEYEALQQKALEFMGLLTVMQYTTQDESMRYQREWLRWQIHQTTLKSRIPNDKLELRSTEFAADIVHRCLAAMAGTTPASAEDVTKAVAAKLIELTKAIRDELQEPNEPQRKAADTTINVA